MAGPSKKALLKELVDRAKGGDGLAMDYASRMARAKEMKASEDTFYHATKSDFPEFIAGGPKGTIGGELYGKGVYTSRDPDVAGGFQSGEGFNILPLKTIGDEYFNKGTRLTPEQSARINQMLSSDNPEILQYYAEKFGVKKKSREFGLDTLDEGKEMIRQAKADFSDSGLPDRYKPTTRSEDGSIFVDYVDPNDLIDFESMDAKDVANSLISTGRSSEILSDLGFKGLDYSDTERLIFDPSNIRSVNAAFDPAKRSSSNLLASAAPAAVGLGALMGGEEAAAQTGDLVRSGVEDYGSITPDEYPLLHQAGDFLEKWTQTPLGDSPVEGLAEWLRGFGDKSEDKEKAERAFWAALDLMP